MKSLADFKRAFRPGQLWSCYNHDFKKDLGVRPVVTVQCNAVSFQTAEGKESWLRFPQRKDLKFIDDKTVQILADNGKPCLTYKRVEGEAKA